MYFNHISVAQGLSQNTVMSVLQDSHGFIWLGTENGLNRWDGYSIKQYRHRGDVYGLSNDFVWAITEDRASDLWLATDGGGLVRWNRHTDRFDSWQRPAPGRGTSSHTNRSNGAGSPSSNRLRTLLFAPDGQLWVGTIDAGLDLFDPRTGAFTRLFKRPGMPAELADASVYALHLDRRGALWVGTNHGLIRLDRATGRARVWRQDANNAAALCGDEVRSILESGSGDLWIGTFGGGLCRFDVERNQFITFRKHDDDRTSLSDNDVRAVFEDDQQRLWVGTANGLNLFDEAAGRFLRYFYEAGTDGLADSYVMSLYQDQGGVLWVGTRSAGVNTWNPRSWSFGHYRPAWVDGTNITSFTTTPGSTWIGTMGRGLVRMFADERRMPQRFSAPAASAEHAHSDSDGLASISVLPDDRVMSLLGARDGTVWVGTMTGGLLHLDPEQPARSVRYQHDPADPSSLAADGVVALFADRRGGLWVGTHGGGVSLLRAGESRFHRYGVGKGGLTSSRALVITEDAEGGIWIGTDQGLNLLDVASGRVFTFRHDPSNQQSISADTIYALHVDREGSLWVGSAGGGLDRVAGSSRAPAAIRFQNITEQQGLPGDVVYGIESDATGSLWLSGNEGLTRYAPLSGLVQTFHRSHGLQAEEFNFGAHHSGLDGRLMFGGANGFNAFAPERLLRSTQPPRVVLTRFEKLDRLAVTSVPHPLLKRAHLAYGENMFTLEFAAMDYTAPAKNRYAYRLEGFDDNWIDAGNEHRATYTNLPAGHYRFRVKAANSDGVWNDAGLLLDVDIDPPPWRTTTAYVGYLMTGALLSWLLYRVLRRRRLAKAAYTERLEAEVQQRTAEISERNEELRVLAEAKGEFVARMSHELRTPMNGVLGMSELLLRTRLDAKQTRLAATIKRSAGSLLGIINDILDFAKIEASRLTLERIPFDIEQLADECVEALAVEAQRKGVEMLCDTPSEAMPRVLGDPLRVRQILANLLGNALKFTERGEIVLRLRIDDREADTLQLCLEVVDTGVGIRPENIERIFESFAQESTATSRLFGGSGLGLSIMRELAELMGGRISVESVPGVGSRFSFRVPLEVADGSAEGDGENAHVLVDKCALLIGADTTTRALLQRHLTAQAMHVLVAQTRDTAFGLLAANAVDLVCVLQAGTVLDMQLAAELGALAMHGGLFVTPLVEDLHSEHDDVATLFRPVSRRVLLAAVRRQLAGTLNRVAGDVPRRPRAAKPARSGHVLVVEDNPVNQEVITSMLEVLGVRASVTGSGEQALELLARMRPSADSVDMVLMDCDLPGMSGYAAAEAVRALSGAVGQLPIVAFTANNTEQGRLSCIAAGMNDVLMKPCDVPALQALLQRCLPSVGVEVAAIEVAAAAGSSAHDMAPARCDPQDRATPSQPELIDELTLARLKAMQRKGGADMLTHLTTLYAEHSLELVNAMRTASAAGDTAALIQAAHSLKSSSANLGAQSLADLCAVLETVAHAGSVVDHAQIVRQLIALHGEVLARLKRETQPVVSAFSR